MIDYGFFEHDYPYTNFHELNLNWILRQMIELRANMRNFVNQNTIKYADPIQWNITTQYEGNTVVIEPNSGNAYISSQPVPAGVAITNEDYWSVIGNFSQLYESIKASIAEADDEQSTTATEPRAEGSLVWLNNILYEVLADLPAGSAYITSGENANVEEISIEDLLNRQAQDLEAETAAREAADTVINSSILTITGQITELFERIDQVVTDLVYITPEQFGAVGDGVTDDTEAIQAMINAAEKHTLCIAKSPDGYFISDSIFITNKINLTLMNFHFILEDHPSGTWFRIDDSKEITFRSCCFEHSSQVIHIFDAEDVFVDQCIFNDCGYCIIQETGHISNNVNVTNCRAYNIRQTFVECNCGVGYDSHNWIITGNICINQEPVSGTQEHCFVTITAVDRVIIANNIAENFKGGGVIQLERVSDSIVVDGNVFRNCAGAAYINITSQGKETIISNNQIVHELNTVTAFVYIGRQSDYTNVKCIIDGNHFKGNGTNRCFTFSTGSPQDPKNYAPILVCNNVIEDFNYLFALDLVVEMVKCVNNVFKATTGCLEFSQSSTYPGRNIKNCTFYNNRFMGYVQINSNYQGTNPDSLVFCGNEFHGDVTITNKLGNSFIDGNIIYSTAAWSVTAGTHTVVSNNFKYGTGILS